MFAVPCQCRVMLLFSFFFLSSSFFSFSFFFFVCVWGGGESTGPETVLLNDLSQFIVYRSNTCLFGLLVS